jgi:hypothetical protein
MPFVKQHEFDFTVDGSHELFDELIKKKQVTTCTHINTLTHLQTAYVHLDKKEKMLLVPGNISSRLNVTCLIHPRQADQHLQRICVCKRAELHQVILVTV